METVYILLESHDVFHRLCLPHFMGGEVNEICLFTKPPYNLYIWSSSSQTTHFNGARLTRLI